MSTIRTFASDNFSAVHPDVMVYLQKINQGHMPSYEGQDAVTNEARKLFAAEFGDDAQVIFVPSGTGANILGLKLLFERPYEALITSSASHIFEEETGALAMNTGAHIFPLPHMDGKLTAEQIEQDILMRIDLGFHSAMPKVVSIANSTELGTFYSLEEVKAIADACHAHGVRLHMDGCRLPNVAAALECSLRECTRDLGVDILSFGGAKNGLMSAEAVVIFDAPLSDTLRMQKQAMQLVSKMRYVSGQFVPYLRNELWRKNAEHANQLARQLAGGLQEKLGRRMRLSAPVTTNQVFCILPAAITKRLRDAGHEFYDWTNYPGEVRFVTAWDNTEKDIRDFIELAGK